MQRLRTWTQGHIEVLRAWQRHGARHLTDWPRLTTIYSHLKALPLARQTQWRRHCKATLWGVALCLAASGVQLVHADTITVDGSCTLVDAITTANSDTNTGGCVQTGTSSLADTIVLTVDTTLTTIDNSTYDDTGLPVVSSKIVIAGNGHTITRDSGAPEFRLLAVNSSGDLTLKDTTVSGGTAASGGGIYNRAGQLRLEGCAVSGNTAANPGGGVFSVTSDTDTVSLVNSTVSGNAAVVGGGVFSVTFGSSALSLVNSTVSGNSAGYGGGVFSYTRDTSTVSLVNSTVSGNSAVVGGGVYSVTRDTSTMELHRSLIAGNTASASGSGDEVRRFNLGGSFLVDDFNLFGHSGLTTADALYGFSAGLSDITATSDGNDPTALSAILATTLADNGGPTLTHALVMDSPAIDAAGACGLVTDQRGFVRNVGTCDIGAYEFGAQSPTDLCETATPTLGCTVNGVLNQPCVGGPGNDVIIGTSGDDVIFGGAGNDKLKGNDGNDLLCGEAGNDRLFGGRGNDTLIGGADNDTLRGEAGGDVLDGGSGNDRLFGGSGNDDLVGGDGTDKLKGDGGIDTCDGETEVTCEL